MKKSILTLVLAAGLPAFITLAQPSNETSTPPVPTKERVSDGQKEKADMNDEEPRRPSDFDGARGNADRNFCGRGLGRCRAGDEGFRPRMAANCPNRSESLDYPRGGRAAAGRGAGYGRREFRGDGCGQGMRRFGRQTPRNSAVADRPCFVMAETILRTLDVNHDGVLDASEIANAIDGLKKLDSNKDGKLSRDEFGGPNRPSRRFGNADVEHTERLSSPEHAENSFGAPRSGHPVENGAPAPSHMEERHVNASREPAPDFPDDAPAVAAVNPD